MLQSCQHHSSTTRSILRNPSHYCSQLRNFSSRCFTVFLIPLNMDTIQDGSADHVESRSRGTMGIPVDAQRHALRLISSGEGPED